MRWEFPHLSAEQIVGFLVIEERLATGAGMHEARGRRAELINCGLGTVLQGRRKDEREKLFFDLAVFFVGYNFRCSLPQEIVVRRPTGGISRLRQ